jgi:hypothetical protein
MGRGGSLSKQGRYRRATALCLVAFGILLGCGSIAAAPDSFSDPAAVTRLNQKPGSTTATTGVLVEQFSFLIKDFKVDHQGVNNNLNITIWYRYKAHLSSAAYPDFMLIARDIEALLTNYPNEEDYWEILNKKITLMVLEKYPAIAKITSQIQVSPSLREPYLRSSIVTRGRTTMRKHSPPRNSRAFPDQFMANSCGEESLGIAGHREGDRKAGPRLCKPSKSIPVH